MRVERGRRLPLEQLQLAALTAGAAFHPGDRVRRRSEHAWQRRRRSAARTELATNVASGRPMPSAPARSRNWRRVMPPALNSSNNRPNLTLVLLRHDHQTSSMNHSPDPSPSTQQPAPAPMAGLSNNRRLIRLSRLDEAATAAARQPPSPGSARCRHRGGRSCGAGRQVHDLAAAPNPPPRRTR